MSGIGGGFGEKIYTLRRQNGLSQDDLAEKLGVSRQTISNWETERVVPDMDKVALLCKIFGISMDELVLDAKARPNGAPPGEGGRGNEKTVLIACIFAMATAILLILLSVFVLVLFGESEAVQMVQISLFVGLIAASILFLVFFAVMLMIYIKLAGKK